MTLGTCIGTVAPYYNLVLVLIVVMLFVKLFNIPSKKTYMVPWKILLFALFVYVIEEVLTVFQKADFITVSKLVNPILEMIIITCFTYMVLLQKKYTQK